MLAEQKPLVVMDGLVDEQPAIISAVEVVAEVRRGRPRKHVDDNVRKRAHKQKQNEPEKQRMIDSIMRKINAYVSKARTASESRAQQRDPLCEKTLQKIRLNIREWNQKMRRSLEACTYMEVKRYYDVLVSRKGIADAKGRLPGERSGEKPQANGMSELETIIAAIHRAEGELPAKPVAPGGPGLISDVSWQELHQDDTEDSYGTRRAPDPDKEEDLRQRAAVLLADKEWDGPRVYEYSLCKSKDELVEYILREDKRVDKEMETQQWMQCIAVGEGAPKVSIRHCRYRIPLWARKWKS